MFCEKLNPDAFERVFNSVDEAEAWLRQSQDGSVWGELGTWNDDGCLPEHYILPKYKDVIAS